MNTYEGLVGKPLERQVSGAGTVYFRTSLADSFTKKGEKITTWHDVVLFVPEETANMIGVGMLVRVSGRQEISAYISKKTQLPVGVSTIVGSKIEILPKKASTTSVVADQPVTSTLQTQDFDVPF